MSDFLDSPTPSTVVGQFAWGNRCLGRIRRSNEAARADLLARKITGAIVLQLVGGVAQSYFDLRQFDLQLEIAEHLEGVE